MHRTHFVIILVVLVTAGWTAAAAADTDPFGFAEDQYSSWGIADAPYPYEGYDSAGNYLDFGCFPVGNGLVFGHLGVDENFNTLRGLTGPGYQTREDDDAWAVWQEGNWPDMPLPLINTAGKPVEWETQSILQLRGAAMVKTVQHSAVGELQTLTYAMPGQPLLIREGIWFETVDDEFSHLDVSPAADQLIPDHYNLIEQGSNRLIVLGLSATDGRGELVVEQGRLLQYGYPAIWNGREGTRFVVAYGLHNENHKPPTLGPISAEALRSQVYSHWQAWSAGNLQFDSGDQRLDDMMAQLPVIIETQRDYYSGSTSPMVSYHGCWVRDNNGPILMYLANRRFDEVKRMLRYHRACCKKYGSSQMLVPLDMDLSDLEGWQPESGVGAAPSGGPRAGTGPGPYPATAGDLSGIGTKISDWENTPVEHAEVPSLIVLQHYWLWDALREAGLTEEADEFIAEAWAFISHNLFTMSFHPEYGVYFHGDETYTQGALYSTYDREESGQIGYPNGYIPTRDYASFDNTILHRAAAAGLAEMAMVLGRIEEVSKANELTARLDGIVQKQYTSTRGYHFPAIATFTGQSFNSPFTNINLRPYWLDLSYGKGFGNDLMFVFDIDGYGTTPWSDFITGHGNGYYLSGMTWLNDLANPSIEQPLLDSATPEGAWCEVLHFEMYYSNETPVIPKEIHLDSISELPDFDDELITVWKPTPIYGRINRIRPWESGINYLALVNFVGREKPELGGYLPSMWDERVVSEPVNTDLLIITKSPDWLDQVRLDSRLRTLPDNRITAWDTGLPFSVDDLRNALLGVAAAFPPPSDKSGGTEAAATVESSTSPIHVPAVPYLYFDRGVRGGLDRRTMKDHEFWYGEEMTQLLADYRAAGGTIIDPDTMQMSLSYDDVVGLKLLVALFPNTFSHSMSAAEIENFHHEVAEWIAWYDAVAGTRIQLELDFIQVNTRLNPLMCGPQGDNVYWMGHEEVEGMLRDRGVPLDHYDNVCAFWAWDGDNTALPDSETAKQAYGGAAQGPGDDMQFLGNSKRTGYFGSAVLADRPDRTSKNALHEFLHNLDAMLELSGEPLLFHPDRMSLNMDTLLDEVPGGFMHLGITDEDMRDMVAAELADEIHYPWPAQLVYYQRAIERVDRRDYSVLLKQFGERRRRMPRYQLYRSFIVPEGVRRYQVYYDGTRGFESLVLEDYDFVEPDNLVWYGLAWPGYLDPGAGSVNTYREAAFEYPDYVEFVLGDAPRLTPGLADLATDTGLPGAKMWVELNGQRLDFSNFGGYEYSADLPAKIDTDIDATFNATKDGYVITPLPVQLTLRPPWELSTKSELLDDQLQLTVRVDGEPGEYLVEGRAATQFNTVQQLLANDGLLHQVEQEWAFRVVEGSEATITIGPLADPAAARFPVTFTVTRQDEENPVSFTHRLSQTGELTSELEAIPASSIPEYIPRCRPVSAVIDGDLSEWKTQPSIVLTPDNGNIFSGSVDSRADAAVVLWLGYDADNLYIAGGVRDDMTPGNGSWDSDRINLCFDARVDSTPDTYPDGAVGHTGWAADDYWVFLNPMLPDGPQCMRLGGERPSGGRQGYYGPVAGFAASVVPEGEGSYRFEWAIPWSSLPYLEANPGGFSGFTMFYSDYDEGLSEIMYLTDWGGSGGIDWRFWDCGLLYFEQ